MLVDIKGVTVEIEASGGLVYMSNSSGEERFIYERGKRPARLPDGACFQYPADFDRGTEILSPPEMQMVLSCLFMNTGSRISFVYRL